MALAFTVTKKRPIGGGLYKVDGTFSSAAGDIAGTLSSTDHGLNYIASWDVSLKSGMIDAPSFMGTVSSGTITLAVSNTLGASGVWHVIGK